MLAQIVGEPGDVAAQVFFAAALGKLRCGAAASFVGRLDALGARLAEFVQTIYVFFFLPRVEGAGRCGVFFSGSPKGEGTDVGEVGVVDEDGGTMPGKMIAISARARAIRNSESFAASSSRSRLFSSSAGLEERAGRPGQRGSSSLSAASSTC